MRMFVSSVDCQLKKFGEFAVHLPEALRGEREPEGFLQNVLMILLGVFAMGASFSPPSLDRDEALLKSWVRRDARMFGPRHKYCLRNLMSLGDLYRSRYLFGDAEVWYEKAMRVCEEAFEPGDPERGSSLRAVAVFYDLYAKADMAEKYYLLALESTCARLGSDAPELCDDLKSLAEVYVKQAKFAKADRCLSRQLEIMEMALGPTHPDLHLPLVKLVGFYRTAGDHEKADLAEEQLRLFEAASLMEQSLGEDHYLVARELEALSDFYLRQGKRSLSSSLSERAQMIALMKKVQGVEYPELAEDLLILSKWLGARARGGDLTMAFRMERRAELIKEKGRSKKTPAVEAQKG